MSIQRTIRRHMRPELDFRTLEQRTLAQWKQHHFGNPNVIVGVDPGRGTSKTCVTSFEQGEDGALKFLSAEFL
jgi:hypothetical protein